MLLKLFDDNDEEVRNLVRSTRDVRSDTNLGDGGTDGGSGVVVDVDLEALDGLSGVETLGADLGAVHDGMALVDLKFVVSEELDALIADGVARIVDPTEGLQQNSRAEVLLLSSPPV